jgi:hypothetical protein
MPAAVALPPHCLPPPSPPRCQQATTATTATAMLPVALLLPMTPRCRLAAAKLAAATALLLPPPPLLSSKTSTQNGHGNVHLCWTHKQVSVTSHWGGQGRGDTIGVDNDDDDNDDNKYAISPPALLSTLSPYHLFPRVFARAAR